MLLQLSFNYDQETKVVCHYDPATSKLKVLGLSNEYFNRQHGGMVRAFYEHGSAELLENASELADFCVQLRLAFKQALRGGTVPPWLSTWLQDIDVYVEDLSVNEPLLRPGMAVRFYREDGPRGSWVWKDTLREMSVLLRPAPICVEL